MNLAKLKECFPANDIEWRLQQAGIKKDGSIWAKCLAYVTNRAIQTRLDEVCGPENWKNEYTKAPDGGVLCGISIKIGDEWVTKWDGAENTDIEGVKGGLSGSMKRAAVQWGIGRYLYNLEEGWAQIADNGKFSGKTKDGKWFNWNPPALPSWALPQASEQELVEATTILENHLANKVFDCLSAELAEKTRKGAQEAIDTKNYERICKANAYAQSLINKRGAA